MVILQILTVFVLGIAEITIGLLYYSPDMLPYKVLDGLKKIIHSTQLSQNITFGVMILLILVMLFIVFMIITGKERKIRKRRKRLIALFEYYGAKYAAEDREINF